MAIEFHPAPGTILICRFQPGFTEPEMVKTRPVIVVSPQIRIRGRLCTVLPISTGKPSPEMPYHVELPEVKLPDPFADGPNWVKADMISAVSFERLDLFRSGRDSFGRRIYQNFCLSQEDFRKVRKAMLCGLGLVNLTKHIE